MSLTLLLVQFTVILVAARACGLVLRALGQPMVIGEMTAGILLGPVVFGAAFPDLHAQLFPAASLPPLQALASMGIVLFMFVVGAEIRAPSGMGVQLKAFSWVGVSSMLLPMVLGLAIAPRLYPTLAPEGTGFWPFAAFLAVALSITAFPVLARILKDRGMTRTRVGQLSLGAAGLVDALAWVLLALVIALASSDDGLPSFIKTSVGLLVLVVVIFGAVRPFMAWMLRRFAPDSVPSPMVLAGLMVGLFACAAVTEWLHLHAVFGAFLFGACLPRDDRLLHALTDRIEPISIVLLMPIFFALAGLGTTAQAFANAGTGPLGLILLVAVGGKIIGGTFGAKVSGYGWRESLATGSLMNARGLMELIVIKVGLDAELIGPELFTILLVMALVTTALTGPLLKLLSWRHRELVEPAPDAVATRY